MQTPKSSCGGVEQWIYLCLQTIYSVHFLSPVNGSVSAPESLHCVLANFTCERISCCWRKGSCRYRSGHSQMQANFFSAYPSCPKVMFSLNRKLSSRSSWVMWHHFSLQMYEQKPITRKCQHWVTYMFCVYSGSTQIVTDEGNVYRWSNKPQLKVTEIYWLNTSWISGQWQPQCFELLCWISGCHPSQAPLCVGTSS